MVQIHPWGVWELRTLCLSHPPAPAQGSLGGGGAGPGDTEQGFHL